VNQQRVEATDECHLRERPRRHGSYSRE
jgi:hypothetical protein